MSKRAVVLMNLGGPDAPETVEPFLRNMFSDKAILGAPNPVRWALARLISKRRGPVAREIYEQMGGGSPIVANTKAQAEALEAVLKETDPGRETRVFIAMRYWHPMTEEAVSEVKAFGPDEVILLPLYPQYSTATTRSSIERWEKVAKQQGLKVPTRAVCCYPTLDGVVEGYAKKVQDALETAGDQPVRVLFSAHGLPKRVIAKGDPYQWQIERCAEEIVGVIARTQAPIELDWKVTYQSRVGPLEWIGPSTDDEIIRAGEDGKGIVLVPIAFVSEHSETLVELDIEYAELAAEHGAAPYLRVPTLGTEPVFISGLAGLVGDDPRANLPPEQQASLDGMRIASFLGDRICPGECGQCMMATR
ncbi:MAG: ferrochelatase [Alphaproteobacteria bacterium]|nr:ferrochelatase [Alphaproteobacteria bacterium]